MSAHSSSNRRNFLKKAALGSLLTMGLPDIVTTAMAAGKPRKVSLRRDSVILFQGDSITDARRKRDDREANSPAGLGTGYAFMAASDLLLKHADKNLKIYNQGISGNKVFQLAERWDNDCLSLQPDVLSLLIGVNDYWHTLTSKYTGTVQTFTTDLRNLLDRTKQKLPDVQLIIGEPFAVTGIKAVDASWFPAFGEYQKAVREIAASYGAVLIPYQSIFDKAQQVAPGVYWTYDGVHPSLAGARLMAQAWLETVKG